MADQAMLSLSCARADPRWRVNAAQRKRIGFISLASESDRTPRGAESAGLVKSLRRQVVARPQQDDVVRRGNTLEGPCQSQKRTVWIQSLLPEERLITAGGGDKPGLAAADR